MNHKTASALSDLSWSCTIQSTFEARLAVSDLQASVDSYLAGKTGTNFNIDITIVGSEQNFSNTGKKLSEHQLFLQKPYSHPRSIEYRNPQYLNIDDAVDLEDDDLVNLSAQHFSSNASDTALGEAEGADQEMELFDILDSSLTHEGLLQRVDVALSVRTVLLS